MLDRIVTPGRRGGASFTTPIPVLPENDWFKILCKVGDQYGRAVQPHIAERKALGHRRYEPFLYPSAFTRLDGLSVTIRKPISEDDIVGRGFFQSTSLARQAGRRRRMLSRPNCGIALRALSPRREIHRDRRDGGAGGAATANMIDLEKIRRGKLYDFAAGLPLILWFGYGAVAAAPGSGGGLRAPG